MLTIRGRASRGGFCDGLSRRSFLRVGTLGFAGTALGGMALPDLLRAEGASSGRRSKAVIMIFLPGGPPHQDMFDLKPEAPREIRGEFRPIETNVPGIRIGEHFPRLARRMDKLAIIRSMVGADGRHYAFQCQTGRTHRRQPPGGWPSFGSTISKLQGPGGPPASPVPAAVGLAPPMGEMRWADNGQPGFLGPAHAPFRPTGKGREDMVLHDVSLDRLHERRELLAGFDRFRRETDASGLMDGMDAFTQQAFGILTSSRLAEALDLDREDERVRDRYGRGSAKKVADGGPRLLDQFLLARRLVESGVRFVTLAFSRWDWHGNNFRRGREDMPMLDQGVSALVDDLHQRGLDEDVAVVVWGEFGRTPKVNANAGRDHWPKVSCALLAGGGFRTGQVIGETNRFAEEAKTRPVTFPEVHATLYHHMGIDTDHTTVRDLQGRPRYLVDDNAQPLPELV